MYEVTATKTKKLLLPEFDFAGTLKLWLKDGYSVSDIENLDEEKGDFVGLCEICETPIFSDDEYHTDENGTCWHKVCDGEVSCYV